jgi:hypothetical protein
MLEEEPCGECGGTGESLYEMNYWGNYKRCRVCRNGFVLTDNGQKQLDILLYYVHKGLQDSFEPKQHRDG